MVGEGLSCFLWLLKGYKTIIPWIRTGSPDDIRDLLRRERPFHDSGEHVQIQKVILVLVLVHGWEGHAPVVNVVDVMVEVGYQEGDVLDRPE